MLRDVDSSWLTPLSKTEAAPAPRVRAAKPKPSLPRRVARRVRRSANSVLGRTPA